MLHRRLALSIVSVIVASCTEEGPSLDTTAEEIRGRPYFNSCSYNHEVLLYSALRAGRWLIDTPEFRTCVEWGHGADDGSTFCNASDTGRTRYLSCDEDDRPSITDALFVLRPTWQWEAIDPQTRNPSGQCLDIPGFASSSARLQMSMCKNPAIHDIRNQVINLIL